MYKGSYCITSTAQNFIIFPWVTDKNFFCLLTDSFFSSLMDVTWVLINKQKNFQFRTTMWPRAPVNEVWNNKVHNNKLHLDLSFPIPPPILSHLAFPKPCLGSSFTALFWLCGFICFFLQQNCSSFPRLGPSPTPSIKIFCLSKLKQCNQFFLPHLAENFLSACFIFILLSECMWPIFHN